MTVFGEILKQAIETVPGARGAAFADWEGETVDNFSAQIGDTGLRLISAHWGVIYSLARAAWKPELGAIAQLLLEFDTQRVLVRRVTDAYFVVMTLGPEGNLAYASRALDRAEGQLREQM